MSAIAGTGKMKDNFLGYIWGNVVTAAGGFTAALSVNEVVALGGLFLAALGFASTFYFNYRRDRREHIESEFRRTWEWRRFECETGGSE